MPAIAAFDRQRVARGGDEILTDLGAVERRELLARFVLVPQIAGQGRESVRCDRDEIIDGEAAGDVLDMWVEPAIFMRDDNDGQFLLHLCRPCDIGADGAIALWRGDVDPCRADARVSRGDHLADSEIGAKRRQHRRGGGHAARMDRTLAQEAAPVERAVHIGVEKVQNIAAEISADGSVGG
jgi:hypothetical protein